MRGSILTWDPDPSRRRSLNRLSHRGLPAPLPTDLLNTNPCLHFLSIWTRTPKSRFQACKTKAKRLGLLKVNRGTQVTLHRGVQF